MRSKKFLLSILAIVLLLCSSCGTTDDVSSDVSSADDSDLLKVIDVVGKDADEAEDLLKDAGFTNISLVADKDSKSKVILDKSNWTVSKQDPSAPFEIASDEEIILTCKKAEEPSTEKETEKRNGRADRKADKSSDRTADRGSDRAAHRSSHKSADSASDTAAGRFKL